MRPTARGWQAVFFGTLSLAVAYLIGTTQIYQLAYALLALLLASLLLGYYSSRGLRYARRVPPEERLFAGRESNVELVLTNAARHGRSPRAQIADRLPNPLLFAAPPVEAGGVRRIPAPVSFPRRGLYELGPAEVSTTDPLGFLRFARRFGERMEVVVYPRVFDLADLPLRGRSAEAEARGAFARRGDEFSGLREYRRGDDRRHIHWKSVARTGELIVREFATDSPRRHAVVLDLHRPGLRVPETEIEDAVSAAASALSHLHGAGLPFRLLLADGEHAAKREANGFGSGKAHFWRAMRMLATARASGTVETAAFLEETPRDELGEGLVLVSRSLGDALAGAVSKLRAAGLPVVVLAVAAHTYRTGGAQGGAAGSVGSRSAAREARFFGNVRRLELAGAAVRVVRREGGVATLAGGRGRGAV